MPEDSAGPFGDAELRIRPAQSAEIDDLLLLEARAFASDRLSRRRFSAHMKSPTASLVVARRDGALAGYALVLIRRGSPAARLYSLAVDPSFLSRGIGARLLARAEQEAFRRGARSLRLEVRTDNAAAIRLYERGGYRTTGRREKYYEDGAAALCYARSLSGAGAAKRLRRAA